MKFHKEGCESLFAVVAFSVGLVAAVLYFLPDIIITHYISYAVSLILIGVVLQFFRLPYIIINKTSNGVLSPADGEVVVIEEVEETEYFKDKRIQVSVFMSPTNVHVNRNPISGLVKYVKYHPGLYLVAWNPKSSTENERTTVVIEHDSKQSVLFRQIAGALARRIVCYVNENDKVEQGEEMGFIKFGSRVDVFLPIGTKININLKDKVKGGITVLAEL